MDLKPKTVLSLSKARVVLVIFIISSIILIYVCKDQTWHPVEVITTPFIPIKLHNISHELKSKEDNIDDYYNDKKRSGYLVDNLGCQIPNIPTISKATKAFLNVKIKQPKCKSGWYTLSGHIHRRGPPLVESNLTTMWIVSKALKHYNVSHINHIYCCFSPFQRLQQNENNYNSNADDISRYSKDCIPFNETAVNMEQQNFEFVRVQCYKINQNNLLTKTKGKAIRRIEIYRDFHAFVPLKDEIENNCNNTSNDMSKNPENQIPSVLIFGIDSVSRLNLLRQLPKTYKLLTSSEFSAISILGYNKLGDNTLPNVVPLLTGYSQKELSSLCWPDQKHKFDICPFIWKNFSERGFRTMYAEDFPSISTFNYKKTGFVRQPTDYYNRPFSLMSWKEIGHNGGSTYKLCTGSRQAFEYTLDYIKKFAIRFSRKLHFGFIWSSVISHESVNYPHIGDNLLADTLKQLLNMGAFNNTILMVMSDHGIRFGKFRETYQGRMEERLPFHLTSFPQWFKERFPTAVANFRSNANNRLVTPFDIHETLKDLLNPSIMNIGSPELNNMQNNSSKKRGISLFQKIPPTRTCDDAEITPHWCTCQQTTEISTDQLEVKAAVAKAINEINYSLKGFSKCKTLKLNYIKNAEKKDSFEKSILDEKKIKLVDYIVIFSTIPGNAILEATVRHYENIATKIHEKDFVLTGPVSRLNTYGNQSYCVTDSKIKLYCFCKSFKQ